MPSGARSAEWHGSAAGSERVGRCLRERRVVKNPLMWFRKLFRRQNPSDGPAESGPGGRTEEEIRLAEEGPLDEPPVGTHGEPGIPRFEPLPEAIDLPPVPGQTREKPLD
jgi:hypothetical protein